MRGKSVGIAELKANLSAYIRRVRRGETMTILDRDTPVAQIGPVDTVRPPLRIRRARGRMSDLRLPKPLETDVDIVALLMEERGER